jgi:hypothetical protein
MNPSTSTKEAPGDNAYFTAAVFRGGRQIGCEDGTCALTTTVIRLCTVVDHLPGTIVHVGANSIVSETFTDTVTDVASFQQTYHVAITSTPQHQ